MMAATIVSVRRWLAPVGMSPLRLGREGQKHSQIDELHEQVRSDYGSGPQGEYHAMTDVIHKVLNDITVDDRAADHRWRLSHADV